MNKKELIDAMAKEAQLPKNKTEAALNAFMKVVNDAMKRNERVTLVGFGTFEVANRKARNGVNPRTGEKIIIPAKKVVKFKVGSQLAETVK
ncbi:MAG TPA: HU family DNA-binding protein [Bacteroidales bacterium]|jgi:DNA-binding protein HU-beta|nr:HU family DNA-binding protein [Bacteroidales bacterium]MDI9575918.1 HU family DNA-binding protein [Bacteroidota bacterium]MDD3755278.1 HU family DNA-binding protein [Bacteroidales bacterium]HHW59750.1 HU family DNA-binding protein [Bacteroidales bacterium]HOB77678.1 HU family DNA-binding protein [Bacteroidales bacterium]